MNYPKDLRFTLAFEEQTIPVYKDDSDNYYFLFNGMERGFNLRRIVGDRQLERYRKLSEMMEKIV